MKAKLFITVLGLIANIKLVAQVTTLPNSIGIGQNTLSTIPLHINKPGEAVRIDGATDPYLSFFRNGTYSGYLQSTLTTFTIGSTNFKNLEFRTNTVPRLVIDGSNGQTTFDAKINANGGLKLTGPLQAQGESVGADGMVLVSKGNATPAWEDQRIGFNVKFPAALSIPNGTDTIVTGYTESYDDGNNFDASSGEFIVPSTGLYRFEYKMLLSRIPPNAHINNGKLTIRLLVNGMPKSHTNFEYTDQGGFLISKFGYESLNLSFNEVVKLEIFQTNENLNPIRFLSNNTSIDASFKGYKIY